MSDIVKRLRYASVAPAYHRELLVEAVAVLEEKDTEIERLRADVAKWRAAVERAASDRTRELESCPYCRKHGEHAYSPCYLHGGCAEAKVEVLEDGMFKFTCPVCGVESGKVREQQKQLERLRAELTAARAESALQPNYSCEHDGCAMREDSGYQEQARKYVDEYYRMKEELAAEKQANKELQLVLESHLRNENAEELATAKALLREVCPDGVRRVSADLDRRIRAALGDEK